jgi:hypothetical protein
MAAAKKSTTAANPQRLVVQLHVVNNARPGLSQPCAHQLVHMNLQTSKTTVLHGAATV